MGNEGNNERVKNWVRSQRTLHYREEAKRDKVHHPVYSTTEALMSVEGLKCPYCQASHAPDKSCSQKHWD